MKKTDLISSNFLLYQTEDGSTRIDVKFENENVWLSQLAIAELYQTTKQNVSRHLLNSYNDGELDYGATVKEFLTVQQEGNRKINRPLAYYSLEAILAVGYRVKSHRGMQFRRWATEKLKELLQKGFVLDDYRLKEAKAFGRDYFDELLERIRDIRSSEKMFYRKITELYSLAVDYDPNAPITVEFYATVQNKLHYAVHGKTAAELISDRANAEKPNMGLTSWKGKKSQENGCGGCQELPERTGIERTESNRHHVFRLCGRPGRTTIAYVYEGLEGKTGCLPAIQRQGNSEEFRESVT